MGTSFDIYERNAERRKVLQAFLDSKLLTMKHGNVLENGVLVGEYDIDYYDKVTINGKTFKYDFHSDSFEKKYFSQGGYLTGN